MENLQSLMRCLDDISKLIPEGTYLEMCDNLKQVHDNIPKTNDRRVPFQVVLPGELGVHRIVNESESESESESDSEDEPWRPEWYDEWTQNEERLRHLNEDIRVLKKTLTTLKPIQRITKKVRAAAMKHFATHSPIFDENVFYQNRSEDGVHAEATFENYVQLSNWSNFSPQERKEFTSKKFE